MWLCWVGDENVSKVMDAYMLRNMTRIFCHGPPLTKLEKEVIHKCHQRIDNFYYGASVEQVQPEQRESTIGLRSTIGVQTTTNMQVEQLAEVNIREPSAVWYQTKENTEEDKSLRESKEPEGIYDRSHNPEGQQMQIEQNTKFQNTNTTKHKY